MTQLAVKPTEPKTARRMSVAQISSKHVVKPWSVFLYGTEKIGKTTFASQAPSPVFVTAEDGLSEIVDDAGNIPAHFPQPETWDDVLDCVDSLQEDKHAHKTVVLDTVDWLEPLLWRHMFKMRKTDSGKTAESIEDYGYGKGYIFALDEWRRLVARLEKLMATRGMNVLLLGHSQVKPFNNPEGVNFDRYTLKVQQKAADFLKEWVKAILFVNYEILAHKSAGEMKAKGVGDGARVMHTQRRPAFDAGNRYGLPAEMQFDFAEFDGYVSGRMQGDKITGLRDQLVALVTGSELETAALKSMFEIGNDSVKLQQLINRAAIKLGTGAEK